VLLFTAEKLKFEPVGRFDNVGNLEEPDGKYLIIDGQHRLAALHFYQNDRPDDARAMHVPCVIFDGKSEDFATEMFVIINSTPTRINKSHLVDLYERVSWAAPDKKFAAKVVDRLYSEGDSPLRYKINRLGGRSKQEKWILQAELFNEIHRWASADWRRLSKKGAKEVDRFYESVRDFLKASEKVWGESWGHSGYMVTKPVTLKALLRVCADLARRTPSRSTAGSSAGRSACPLDRADARLPQRGLLRALPRQGAGRARGPRLPRAGQAGRIEPKRGKNLEEAAEVAVPARPVAVTARQTN
jgi:DGQHR domain-containing protein